MRIVPVATLLAAAMQVHAAGEPYALVTVKDGDAALVRDAGRYAFIEGVRLAAGDIVESTAGARLVRIEFADGYTLDLGPATKLLLAPHFAGERARTARVYLLAGWAKLSATATPAGTDGAAALVATLVAEVAAAGRGAVVRLEPGPPTGVAVFAESGTVALAEHSAKGGPDKAIALKTGEFYTRAAGAPGAVTQRPTADFLDKVPRPFLDTLPLLAPRFAAREAAPKLTGPAGYTDLAPWLGAEASLRPGFIARWKALAQQPEFRTGLISNMRTHPEWDRIVFPERYALRKPAPHVGAAPAH